MKKSIPARAWIYLLIAILISVFIIVNACLPSNPSTQAASPAVEITANIVNWISPGTVPDVRPEPFVHLVRKVIGHFGLFGLQGIFCYMCIYYIFPLNGKRQTLWTFIPCLSYGLLLAILTELIQKFVPGRSGEIGDALIDFSGFAVAVGGMTLIYLLILHTKKKALAKQS